MPVVVQKSTTPGAVFPLTIQWVWEGSDKVIFQTNAMTYADLIDWPAPAERQARTAPKIRPDRKAHWIAALRSGYYVQTFGEYFGGGRFRCALAVGMSLAGIERVEGHRFAEWLGLSWGQFDTLAARVIDMNDTEHKSFAEIAVYLDSEW